jgi:tetratricopeptide (TPR) repeat protein/transcriptional regulator with XRE-family HTH domain
MPATGKSESASQHLGAALRSLRRSRGLAQRDLLRPLHLGSHSAIVDYEAGRRIPPDAVIGAYERFFELPGGTLRKLREQALAERAADEAGARPSSARLSTERPKKAATPRQLPATPETFTGRVAELAQLDRLLRDRETSTPVVISAVSGMGGIGKTALAVYWAHQARDNFRDGELYIDMQGYHPSGRPVTPEAAMSQFLAALGVETDRMPVALAQQAGLFRTLMADRQMLVLLDNVRDVDQVRPLLPGSPGCRVLITSRSRLSGLAVREGALRIALDNLDLRDAVRLLRRMIGVRATDQPGATAALANLCGLHPLALRIAAERVIGGDGAIADAVTALASSSDRLSSLAVPDDDSAVIRKVFTWSYEGLDESERRLFRLLGLHDGPDITLAPCAALAGLGEEECASQLAALVDAHLVDTAEGRYRLHDLLRLFAYECLMDTEPAADREDAAFRLAAWYLSSACAARSALDQNLPPLAAVQADLPVPPMAFSTETAALAWCDAERANLTATALSASERGLYEIGWKLPTALFPYFDRGRHYGDWIATHRAAITAAHHAGDREAEGKVTCNLGSAYRPMRRFTDAAEAYERALELFREVGWIQGTAKALGNLATTYDDAGDHGRGVEFGLAAIAVFRELGDKYGEALSLANIGGSQSELGRQDEAMQSLSQALAAFSALGDRRGMARVQNGLGVVHARSGRAEAAVPILLESARTFDEIGDPHEQATALADLAEIYMATGRQDEARRCAGQAAEIFARIGEDWLVAGLRSRLPDLVP